MNRGSKECWTGGKPNTTTPRLHSDDIIPWCPLSNWRALRQPLHNGNLRSSVISLSHRQGLTRIWRWLTGIPTSKYQRVLRTHGLTSVNTQEEVSKVRLKPKLRWQAIAAVVPWPLGQRHMLYLASIEDHQSDFNTSDCRGCNYLTARQPWQ
jgi:hypothetical protein